MVILLYASKFLVSIKIRIKYNQLSKKIFNFRSLVYSSAYSVQSDVTLFSVIITCSKLQIPSARMGIGVNRN